MPRCRTSSIDQCFGLSPCSSTPTHPPLLLQSANEWVDALGDRRFLGGQQPNNADLSMFGVIRAVTGTPTFHDLMHNTRIGAWYEHMMGAVGESARIQ